MAFRRSLPIFQNRGPSDATNPSGILTLSYKGCVYKMYDTGATMLKTWQVRRRSAQGGVFLCTERPRFRRPPQVLLIAICARSPYNKAGPSQPRCSCWRVPCCFDLLHTARQHCVPAPAPTSSCPPLCPRPAPSPPPAPAARNTLQDAAQFCYANGAELVPYDNSDGFCESSQPHPHLPL